MSAYDLLLAQLAGGITQDSRLLALHTPLGRDVLLAERATVWEAVGPHPAFADAREPGRAAAATPPVTGWRAEIHALAADTHLELKRLIGQPVLLELLTQQSRSALRPWHGHVTAVELCGSDGGLARYKLTVEPWLAFLGQRQDSWIFQRATVRQILEELFADYAGQGRLVPAWRFELADESVYPERSLTTQYAESDLAFFERLLREEGLFYWFEHAGDTTSDSLGQHTLVIADHNGAFKTNVQARVRYTQSAAALPEDSLVRVAARRRTLAASLSLASADYRSLGLRPAAAQGLRPVASLPLAQSDVPGLYSHEDSAQGERLVLRQMQALDALRLRTQASGSWRQAAAGTTFILCDHPEHDGHDEARDRQVVLSAVHRARNNLGADAKAQLLDLLAAIAQDVALASGRQAVEAGPADEEPLHQVDLVLQPAAVPVRAAATDAAGLPDVRLHRRPTIHGVQTALVVGSGAPVHTDRDHRIKIQFHWQRGANASHRLGAPNGDNAPANDASGTWVRVAEAWAGANWGSAFTPRVGQEVLVAFVGGDIDRPVVVGSAYNAQGQPDAQGSQVSGGAAGAHGDTPPWFPGEKKAGELQGHQHAQVLAGYKCQELAASGGGAGGYNQLVFDDSPGAGRLELSTTQAQTRLQIGHLLQQQDNQRLQLRGHGLDLGTQAWGAVRAGAGLMITAHARPASTASARQMDSREPLARLGEAQSLLHTLAESAQDQQARGAGEPALKGARRADTARQLDNERGLYAAMHSLASTDQRGGDTAPQAGDPTQTIGGGLGTITAWSRPDLVVAAPSGIAWFTPATSVQSAGATHTSVAGQDINRLAQRRASTLIKGDITLYTYGKASNPNKPNRETGIRLHAASGSVSLQAQASSVRADADRNLEVASTQAQVRISAPKKILLTAAGAAIEIQPGGITLKGPGKVDFKASMKELAGAGSLSASVDLKKPATLKGCAERLVDAALTGSALV